MPGKALAWCLAGALCAVWAPAWADNAALVLQGRGVQVYRCQPAAGAYAWRFVAPEATLFGADGASFGRHFAGPSWQANDGSTVVGAVAATGAAPDTGAIPWLVLRAASHAGAGAFASVAFVVRSATQGGVAPAAGCDAAHVGAEARVPYSATYTFFPAG